MNATSTSAAPLVDVLVQSPLWEQRPSAVQTVETAIAAAAAHIAAPPREVAVLLTDDESIRALNRDWRKIDKPTNVLSFPAAQTAQLDVPHLGDIVVAYETLARECADENKEFTHHLAHLSVHGFLHLMGYDHETDSGADAMERLESAILARLGVPDPYVARDLASAPLSKAENSF
jgi:probable rRNA maturation factor